MTLSMSSGSLDMEHSVASGFRFLILDEAFACWRRVGSVMVLFAGQGILLDLSHSFRENVASFCVFGVQKERKEMERNGQNPLGMRDLARY
jgi:hypothetical protein